MNSSTRGPPPWRCCRAWPVVLPSACGSGWRRSSWKFPRKRGAGTDRDVLARRLEALSLLVRDLGVVNAPPADASDGEATTLANPDLGRDLAGMARHFDTARVLNSFAVVEQARRSLDRYQSAKVVADWLVCEM